MAISEGTFLEIEKRLIAFKHVFNTLNTSVHTSIRDEKFETSHQIYLDDLITGYVRPSISGTPDPENVQPARTKTWTANTVGANAVENTLLGYLSEPTITEYVTNPNVEQITIPLYILANSGRQSYFAYQPIGDEIGDGIIANFLEFNVVDEDDISGDASYKFTLNTEALTANPERRIRSWIAPTRFGVDYAVEVFQSNESYTGPDTDTPLTVTALLGKSGEGPNNNKVHGGYAFDYYQGMLYLAPNPDHNGPLDTERPYIPGFRHPLWLRGYRYIGPTGSNMTVAGAESATAGGSGGVATTLTSAPAGARGEYQRDEHGWFDTHTLTATDTNDIMEFRSADKGIIISASFGDTIVTKMNSASYNNITHTPWEYYDDNDTDKYNGANLFKFGSDLDHSNSKFPDFSSYGVLRTVPGNPWITQSFEFQSPTRLEQVGVVFSNDDSQQLLAGGVTAEANLPPATAKFPDAIKIEASNDTDSWTQISHTTGIKDWFYGRWTRGPGYGDRIRTTYPLPDNDQTYTFRAGQLAMPNEDLDLNPGHLIYMYQATSSITDTTEYKYYRLYVSGGQAIPDSAGDYNLMALHHIALWENLNFGPTNRKQVNFEFNQTETAQQGFNGRTLTEFDLIVSASAARVGYTHVLPTDLEVFDGGTVQLDLDLLGTSNIVNANTISASIISSSNVIATNIHVDNLYGTGSALVFPTLTASKIQANTLDIIETLNIGAGLALESGQSLFMTNRKQDGSEGTDEFSARVFGNYVEGSGVSDMYMDAYRIYAISDAKTHIRTLHPTLGSIVLESALTHVSGTLSASSAIVDNISIANDMTISGSILISGSIIPNTDASSISSFDLGSPTAKWRDLHLSKATIRFYDGDGEKATISFDDTDGFQIKSGESFQQIKVSQIVTDNGVQLGAPTMPGFISVQTPGKGGSTILRSENEDYADVFGNDGVFGSITQKGSGSFAIILDASNHNEDRAKFSVFSNAENLIGATKMLFQVSESGETRVHGYLNVSQSIISDIITAQVINATSLNGTFVGALSSSVQIAEDISGSFNSVSSSLDSRLTGVETIVMNTLISGSSQLSTEISGAFTDTSASLESRITSVEFGSTLKQLLSGSVQIASEISGAFTDTSASLSTRIDDIISDQSNLTTVSNFNALTSSIELKADIAVLQPLLNATASYAITGSDVIFGEIASTKITSTVVTASNLHTNIFNPLVIDTSILSASLSTLGTITSEQAFIADDHNRMDNTLRRPVLTIQNKGGSDITYFGYPIDGADAFVKFQANRSNSHYVAGIQSEIGSFVITSGSYLNANSPGASGIPPFAIHDNKVGIVRAPNQITYTLDVGGDIRSQGTLRADTITHDAGSTITTLTANAYVRVDAPLVLHDSGVASNIRMVDVNGSNYADIASSIFTSNRLIEIPDASGTIALAESVVANSATSSFLTVAENIDGGTF